MVAEERKVCRKGGGAEGGQTCPVQVKVAKSRHRLRVILRSPELPREIGRRVTIARPAAAATCRRTTGAGHLLSVAGHDVAAMPITGSERTPRTLYRDSAADYALVKSQRRDFRRCPPNPLLWRFTPRQSSG
jgi:hypothetical protein